MFAKKSISRICSILFVIVFILSLTPLHVAHAAGVRYAKTAASGTGDCLSWADACTLQTALTGATSGDDIWVMSGSHKTTTGTDRTATFQLKNSVAIYGGFAGTETERTQRNPAANVTTLSGDIGTPGNASDNSYHVVTGATGATLDGFSITGGKANGAYPNNVSGGMYNVSSSPTLTNVTFSGNMAYFGNGMYNKNSNPELTNVTFISNWYVDVSPCGDGGGMYNDSSSPILTNVTFNSNTACYGGGGISNHNGSNPKLNTVIFNGNQANNGGGMYNSSSNPELTNVLFSNNLARSTGDGGGMFNNSSSPTLSNVTFSGNSATYGGGMSNRNQSNPTLTNVTFNNNSAVYNFSLSINVYGGGMYNASSGPTLSNVTFNGNTAVGNPSYNTGYGGGMYNVSSSSTLTNVTFSGNVADYGGGLYNSNSSPTIRNTIIWGNTANKSGSEVLNSSGSPVMSYSVVQFGYAGGTNIITTNPLLGTLGNYGGFTQTIPLLAGSSAIDTGNDSVCPVTDQRGVTRPQGAHCDIGAFEVIQIYSIYLPLVVR